MPDSRGWLVPALAGVLAVTLARVALLAFNRTDLFVDEAQYWLWGQSLEFGYYSKPPLVAWVIRLSTELAGSDAPFWVRLPAPLLHTVTSLVLGYVAARMAGRAAGIAVAMAFVTLPMVTVASELMSTDTVMFPFLAIALGLWLWLLDGGEPWAAPLAGAALGLAFLAKYAALYYIGCAALAAALMPVARPGWRAAGFGLLAFLVMISPNLIWNLQNGLTTVEHTLDNADWVRDPGARAGLNLAGLAEFFLSQFAVFGPILFGALLILTVLWRRIDSQLRLLLLFTLPIIALVCVQALLSRAYANWAAAAYIAGTLAVVPWLLNRPRGWLIASFAIAGSLAAAVPLATLRADSLRLGGPHLALERYVGRSAMSEAILAAARDRGLMTIVSSDRDVLADLFYTGRGAPEAIYALPPKGRAMNHYALTYPYPGGDAPALLVIRQGKPHPCPVVAEPAGVIAPKDGAYRRHPQILSVVPGDCLAQAGTG